MNAEVIKALAVTAELCGTELTKGAATAFAADLSQYPPDQVIAALGRCRRELKGRLTLAEVISRIDDGRPGADEAWALLPWAEEQSAVVTSEMLEAMGVVRSLYLSGDHTGARFAFRDAYTRLVTQAREERRPVEWQASLGWDPAGRAACLRDALQRNRISARAAERLLPGVSEPERPCIPPPAPINAALRRLLDD